MVGPNTCHPIKPAAIMIKINKKKKSLRKVFIAGYNELMGKALIPLQKAIQG